jgi:hypothetical protein
MQHYTNNFCIQSPMTFQMSTHRKSSTSRLLFRSHLSSIGRIGMRPRDTTAPSAITRDDYYVRTGTAIDYCA